MRKRRESACRYPTEKDRFGGPFCVFSNRLQTDKTPNPQPVQVMYGACARRGYTGNLWHSVRFRWRYCWYS